MIAETRVTLRLPEDLATLLREQAAAARRSLNKQIVFLLEQATFSSVDADAYSQTRRTLAGLPRYSLPRPYTRRPPRNGGEG
jgi:hypothetical protein